MQNAGFTKREFPFSNNHSVYIRGFVAARKTADAAASYWGYRLLESAARPEVGDLIGYVRPDTKTSFEEAQAYSTGHGRMGATPTSWLRNARARSTLSAEMSSTP
jgi:hypothetical protein